MKKLVNGKVVDIRNIELFEMAAEGVALRNVAISNTDIGVPEGIDTELMNKLIGQYDVFYKAMPYPLYAVEHDIKYATLANFIKMCNRQEITMWVDGGLFILLDDVTGSTIHIANNTWSFISSEPREPRTDMLIYKNCVGYDEYCWVLDKLINKRATGGFYETFMKEFVDACNGNEIVLRLELQNILNFGNIPKRLELIDDRIIDFTENCEYMIDIYISKTVDDRRKEHDVWSICGNGETRLSKDTPKKTIFGFKGYRKPILNDQVKEKGVAVEFQPCSLIGLQNVFLTLSAIKNTQGRQSFPVYKGVAIAGTADYQIKDSIYVCKLNRISEQNEIARGASIYGVDRNSVYFSKESSIADGVTKETLYSYNVASNSLRLCNIRYRY